MYFIARRLVITLLTLFLVSVLTFLAFNVVRGDPASLILGTEATEEQLAALREEMGLDRSLPVRYVSWLGNFLTGNLGNSVRFRGESISGLILDRLPVTFCLACLALVFILLFSFPAALISARREGGLLDRLLCACTSMSISFPGFFLAVLFIWIFGILLNFFSPGTYVSYRESPARFFGGLIFPALAVAIPNAAIMVKFLRTSILQQLRFDYVRTAYSKGASARAALYRHVLKNAIIPALTLLGMIIAEIFSGSIIIEQVFTIPGIGRLLIASIASRDYPMIQTLVVYITFIVVFANTLADICIRLIDPRIRAG
ncbi:MAG: ABC transporter permease [Spirochaetales bacterium]|jgi:ABC-type dipeptide/oligopeptide/nickel transport system permease component|nr:ABC transporter permease [Spirochaetales bacterium]